MRFCKVTTFYPPYHFGGDAVFIQQLSIELAKRGHHVEVVYCKDTYNFMTTQQPTAAREDHPNVRVHTLESSFGLLSRFAIQISGSHHTWERAIAEGQVRTQGFMVVREQSGSLRLEPRMTLQPKNGLRTHVESRR